MQKVSGICQKKTIELYETYRIKSSPNAKGVINYPNSMDMGALFLENAVKLLEDGLLKE